MDDALNVRLIDNANTTVIEVTGEVDADNASMLDAAVTEVLASGRKLLEVDLARVDYIGSQGVQSLVLAERRARDSGATFTIVAASPIVHFLLEIVDLTWMLAPDAGGEDATSSDAERHARRARPTWAPRSP